MKFSIQCEEKLLLGAKKLAEVMGVDIGEGGVAVCAVACDKPTLRVTFDGKNAVISYQKQCQFNRAFGLLVQNLQEGKTSFDVTEQPAFDMNGIMFDMCQGGAAFTVPAFCKILDRLALMGLDMAMLYVEDNYEIKEYPFFGYMRPTYSQAELKAIDDYADSLGIEMIPCIQTLAHLSDALRWNVYGDIKDYQDCLLVGSEDTYKFLENVIRNAAAPFRSKRIHIGMDEAFRLGTGYYLEKNGYHSRVEIMTEHLKRVNEIVRKLGLQPMMWDDMFFSMFGSKTYRQTGIPVPADVKAAVPEGMQCVYWDYNNGVSDERFAMQIDLCGKPIFAGGVWSWLSYGLAYDYTAEASVKALKLCRKHGVSEVFVTTWGDAQSEILQSSNLFGAQIFAEMGYNAEWDEKEFGKRFRFCTGMNAEDLRMLQMLDRTPGFPEDVHQGCACDAKVLMWQDVMEGMFDKNYEGKPLRTHYEVLGMKLHGAEKRNGEFNDLFRMSAKAADVLALKADMGLRLRAAYLAGNKAKLKEIAENDLPELTKRVEALRQEHRAAWFAQYKPFGWDIMDLRYGGLLSRISTAEWQVKSYLNGETDSLPELAADRLLYENRANGQVGMNQYGKIATASRLDFFAATGL